MGYVRKLQRLLPLRYKVIEPDAAIDLGRFVTFPDGYHPTNPSIVRHGQDFVVCVRGVPYSLDEKLRMHGNPNRLPSLNRVFVLRDDMASTLPVALPQDRLDNVEDLKLFSGLGRIWGMGSIPTSHDPETNACEMTLIEFDEGLTDCRFTRLPSPFGFRLEKNWAPFVADDALHFLYSSQPLLLLRYDPVSRSVNFVGSPHRDRSAMNFLEGGSSGGFPTRSGIMFLTHRRVVRLPSRTRIYLSRIRWLSENLASLAAGPFFSIGRPTVQFANGMQVDEDRVLISYGEMDARAQLACLSRERFERAVFPEA